MISSDTVYEQRPTDEPTVTQLLEFMFQREIHVTACSGAYSGDYNYNVSIYNGIIIVYA